MQVPDGREAQQEELLSTADLDGDLRGRSIRGGMVTLSAQAFRFAIQLASTVALARLLHPGDFGLIGMVTAITGFVELFMDLGLSAATVQRSQVTHGQVSTLFWINLAVGASLTALTAASAPAVAAFYGEPRLVPLTLALSAGFVIGGLGVQQQALLRRRMRFTSIAAVDIASNLVAAVIAVATAAVGFGAWSLVAQRLSMTAVSSCGLWIASRWRPGFLFELGKTRSMLAVGGHLTGFNTINYFIRNADNVLIGRWWGPEQLGLYGRAYQLLLLPVQQINGPIGNVVLPALSRLQNDPARFRSFYLQVVALLTAITMPLIVLMTVLSNEIVEVVLGPQWQGAALIFRLLAGAIAVQPLCSTTGWLYVATGRTDRMFRWSLGASVLILVAFLLGIPYGAVGVASGYSAAMLMQTVPCLWFAIQGTGITLRDIGATVVPATASAALAGCAVLAVNSTVVDVLPAWARLLIVAGAFSGLYCTVLLGAFRQRGVYTRILREIRPGIR